MAVVSTELHDALHSFTSVGAKATGGADTNGGHAVISGIQIQRCGFESSYHTYTVTLSFSDRPDLRVFLKDYGSFERAKEDMQLRRERERYVYSTLLAAEDLGTARLHGSVWDDARSRFWLFLEFVDGTALKFSCFEHWLMAAAWLGRLHGRFARCPEKLQQANVLIAHDPGFFSATAERALRAVHDVLPAGARDFERIVNRYDALVKLMTAQPRTLVHGAYRPTQILVDATQEPPRLCPVDWELAAIGSGLYDLAHLADGFRTPRLERVFDAYRQAALSYGIAVPAPDDLERIVDAFRLHMVFSWLSKAVEREYATSTVVRLTELAHQITASVLDS